MDFSEVYYDEEKDHFHLTRVRNGETELDISIPFSEVTATECLFDGMVSLRTCSDLVDDDYVASIPMSDWIAIVNQERKSYKQRCEAEDSRRLQESRDHPKKYPFPAPSLVSERESERSVTTAPTRVLDANSTYDGGLYSTTPSARATTADEIGSMLHSYAKEVEPAEPESDLLKEFNFLEAVDAQDKADATFLTGYLSEDSVRHVKSITPVPETITKEDEIFPVEPTPPAESMQDGAAAKQASLMRKLYRKFKPIKSFDGVDVDCMYRGLRRGSVPSALAVSTNNDRSPSPTARKPAKMSAVHDEEDAYDMAVVKGGRIDDMSISIASANASAARHLRTADNALSVAINLHSQSFVEPVESGPLTKGTTRPSTHTSTVGTGELPSNIRTRPFTTQAHSGQLQQKQSLQTKLLDADIARPLKAGYSLTTTVSLSPRCSSSHTARAKSALDSSIDPDDHLARYDSQVRRPGSMPRSNRSPRAHSTKTPQVGKASEASEIAILTQMLNAPPVGIAPPPPAVNGRKNDKGVPIRRKQVFSEISSALRVVNLQQPTPVSVEPSAISLHSS
jgi:hypothetical protein